MKTTDIIEAIEDVFFSWLIVISFMNPSYIIYLLTFLGFPLLGLVLYRYIDVKKNRRLLRWAFLIFAIHNLFFLLGFSIKGDYVDYSIFSLEYLYLSLLIFFLYKSTSIFLKVIRTIGSLIIGFGFLQGLAGILMFIIISQDYETDKIYNFGSNKKDYQTRRYSFGFATLDDTRYTFETYRRYNYLPFEKLINKVDLFELKTSVDFRDKGFTVNISDSDDKQLLEFSSSNGKKHLITID